MATDECVTTGHDDEGTTLIQWLHCDNIVNVGTHIHSVETDAILTVTSNNVMRDRNSFVRLVVALSPRTINTTGPCKPKLGTGFVI